MITLSVMSLCWIGIIFKFRGVIMDISLWPIAQECNPAGSMFVT